MKKIILMLLLLLYVGPVKAKDVPEITNHEKVTIHIFRGSGCTHCADAIKYFYKLEDKYSDYFEVVSYETWENTDNNDLMKDVLNYFDDENKGVPYIVIGSSYHKAGYNDELAEKIIDTALLEYENSDYEDVVTKYLTDKTVQDTVEEAALKEGLVGKYDTVIVILIFTVVIGGFSLLLYKSKRK